MTFIWHMVDHRQIASIIREFTWSKINISCLFTFNKYGSYRTQETTQISIAFIMENLEDGLTRCGYNIFIGCVLHIVDLFRVFAVTAHDKPSRNYVYLNEVKISFLNSQIYIYTNRTVILGVYNTETRINFQMSFSLSVTSCFVQRQCYQNSQIYFFPLFSIHLTQQTINYEQNSRNFANTSPLQP